MKGIHPRHTGARLHILNSDHICDNMRSNIIKHSNEFKTVGKRYEIINSSWQQEGFFFKGTPHHLSSKLLQKNKNQRKAGSPCHWKLKAGGWRIQGHVLIHSENSQNRLHETLWQQRIWKLLRENVKRPMCVLSHIQKYRWSHIYMHMCVYIMHMYIWHKLKSI